jgi:hypothetical protein
MGSPMVRTLCALCLLLPAAAFADGPDVARLDELFLKRGDPEAAKQEDALLAEAMKAKPDDPQVLWRQARWNSWKADGLPNGDAKKNISKQTWELGDKAAKLLPSAAEGYYYAALGIGQYSEAVGILNALAEGLEGKFNERLDKSIQLNASLDSGGPLVTKGRYFFSLPWPMRNLGKSAEWLNKCLAKHPYNLRAHLYLAETLLKDGKAREAKAHIDQVMTGSDSYDPAEVVRVRAQGKKLKVEIEKELQ